MATLNAVTLRWQAPRVRSAFAAGLMLVMAACAAGPKKPVVVGPPPVVALPAVKPAPLPEAQQNRVALLVPLTGPNAPVGQSIANAANMALLDAGDKRVNLRIYDTAGGAEAAAARALTEGAGLFLGPLLAGDVRAVQAVAATKGVPVISFSNDSGLAGGDVYILGFQPGQSIARTVSYARARGVERFAALVPAGTYGQRAQTAFVRAVEAAGGRSTAVVAYTREPARMLAAARRVTAYDERTKGGTATIRTDGSVAAPKTAALPFQALLIADGGSVAAQLLPALGKMGVMPGVAIVMGTELWNNEPGLANVGPLRGALFSSVSDERFRKLAERYRAKFGNNPSRLASFGYDSVLLVNSLAGNWALGTPFPKAALGSRDGFAGIDGAFRFGGGNVAERMLEVQQVGAGAIAVVSPAPKGW
ncbi:MAG: penicillin-binding protein activator [Sandarakinorhabdus sp.]|nr:penicillin-binding protein activator [Sandarakinorhabdus sp.]